MVFKLRKLGREEIFLISTFVFALIIRLIVFLQNGNHAADGMYRVMLAENWLKAPYFITGDLWPPLHLYMTAFATMVLGDPLVSTRLVSLIFGVLIIFPYYYLVKMLFSKSIAMISTLILAVLSIHVQYSTYTMSEIPFAFFLIISLLFLFRFKESANKNMTNLIISAVFLNMACMTRYEGWLFIPLMAFLIIVENRFIKREYAKYSLIFISISLIFPIFWMIGNYNLHGDAFYGQTWSDSWIKTNIMLKPDSAWLNPPIYQKLITWPVTILSILNIVGIFAIIGILVSLYEKKNLEFLSIFIILIGLFTYKLFNLTMISQSRHMIVPILFMIPYFTIGLDFSLETLNKDLSKYWNKNWNIIIIVLVIAYFVTISSYAAIEKNPYITPRYITNISKWLHENVKSNETVLLDEYNWWGLHIIMYSELNTTFTEDYLKTHEFVTDQIRIVPEGGKKIDGKIVISYLEKKPTYMVYFLNGKLNGVLNFSSECKNEIRFNYSFECKYSGENYNIYSTKQAG